MQVRKRLRKVAKWAVDKFHNRNEHDSGFTSIPNFTSPSKDQHFDGLHVIEVESVEKDRQLPNMHTDLEKPRLK